MTEGGSDGTGDGGPEILGIKEEAAVGKELIDGDSDGYQLGSPLGINEGECAKVSNVLGWLIG